MAQWPWATADGSNKIVFNRLFRFKFSKLCLIGCIVYQWPKWASFGIVIYLLMFIVMAKQNCNKNVNCFFMGQFLCNASDFKLNSVGFRKSSLLFSTETFSFQKPKIHLNCKSFKWIINSLIYLEQNLKPSNSTSCRQITHLMHFQLKTLSTPHLKNRITKKKKKIVNLKRRI